jgi:hypothetical protein
VGRIVRGILWEETYEIEIENLMIPSTRYPNDFSFLFISHRTFLPSMYPSVYPIATLGHYRGTQGDVRERSRIGKEQETYLLNNFNSPTLILNLSHIENWFPVLQYPFNTIRGE